MTDKTPPTPRPLVVYRHVPVDIAIKDPSPLISDIRELCFLGADIAVELDRVTRLLTLCEQRGLPSRTGEERDLDLSHVTAARRAPVEGENEFTDWTVPGSVQVFASVSDNPFENPADRLAAAYDELDEMAQAHRAAGVRIDAAIREMASIPAEVPDYRAQSTSGRSGWKICVDSRPRVVSVEYRAYWALPDVG